MALSAAISGSIDTVMNPHMKNSVVTVAKPCAHAFVLVVEFIGSLWKCLQEESQTRRDLHQRGAGRKQPVAERQDRGADRGRVVRQRGARDRRDRRHGAGVRFAAAD